MTATSAIPLPPPQRTYGWRSWSDPLREWLLAIAIGCAFSLIEAKARNELPPFHTFVRNAILALSIITVSRGLETMLSWAIEQSRIPTTFRTIVYAFGAWLGFFLGLLIVASLYGTEENDFRFHSFHVIYSITAAVLGACVVGFILHHNRKRNDRMLLAMARLKEHEFAEKELEIARAMQHRLLPPADIERDGYRVSARTQAAHLVGGDFYDVFSLADGAVAILAADVSGKGIAASLLMASCKATVPFLAASGSAAEVMNALNINLCDQLQRREFVAMIFGRFEPESGKLELVNAGMPDPFVIRGDGSVRTLSFTGDRLPLGAMRTTRYDATHVTLAPGDRLLLFSDGLPEALVGGVPVGYERIEEYVHSSRSVDELLEKLRGTESVRIEDDVTVVMLERSGGVPPALASSLL